jgi:serine/threonine-protein phosphatase PGAM5
MRNFRLIFNASMASIALVGVTTYKLHDTHNKVNAAWTTSYEPTTKWDFNWDKRDPKYLLKPKSKTHSDFQKEKEQQTNTIQSNEVLTTTKTSTSTSVGCQSEFHEPELNRKISKARRHLILVRHGQYETHQRESDKKILTLLGQEQADFTGKRLGEINYKNCKLYHSTMIRAIQTANIVRKYIDQDIPVIVDDMLKEGAPIPPEVNLNLENKFLINISCSNEFILKN